jgi:hypothetical protein
VALILTLMERRKYWSFKQPPSSKQLHIWGQQGEQDLGLLLLELDQHDSLHDKVNVLII